MVDQRQWHCTDTPVWRIEGDEITLFHVFGVVACQSGSVLCFAEARLGQAEDADPHHLWMRKSADGGFTFGPTVCLADCGGTVSYCNPVPVYDRETNRVWLFYARNHDNRATDVYLMYSDDEGDSWSEPDNMNRCFAGSGLAFHLPGPGHGIQLTCGAHKGRLIVPFWHRRTGVETPMFERGYCTCMLWSDDHGLTWQTGAYAGSDWYANETRICETLSADGRSCLLMQGRRVGDPQRWQMRSYDDGATWQDGMAVPLTCVNTCDCGLLRVDDGGRMHNAVLVSRCFSAQSRRDMEIQISLDGGASYAMRYELPKDDVMPGYSDLTQLPDGTIGLMHPQADHLLFTRLSLETLTGGWYHGERRKVWLW